MARDWNILGIKFNGDDTVGREYFPPKPTEQDYRDIERAPAQREAELMRRQGERASSKPSPRANRRSGRD